MRVKGTFILRCDFYPQVTITIPRAAGRFVDGAFCVYIRRRYAILGWHNVHVLRVHQGSIDSYSERYDAKMSAEPREREARRAPEES